MGDPDKLRVSDAEREGLIEELHEHTVAGRLTAAELDERLGAVYEAKTRADLDRLRDDLPISAAAAKRAMLQRRSHLRRRMVQEAGGSLTASLVCVAICTVAKLDLYSLERAADRTLRLRAAPVELSVLAHRVA